MIVLGSVAILAHVVVLLTLGVTGFIRRMVHRLGARIVAGVLSGRERKIFLAHLVLEAGRSESEASSRVERASESPGYISSTARSLWRELVRFYYDLQWEIADMILGDAKALQEKYETSLREAA